MNSVMSICDRSWRPSDYGRKNRRGTPAEVQRPNDDVSSPNFGTTRNDCAARGARDVAPSIRRIPSVLFGSIFATLRKRLPSTALSWGATVPGKVRRNAAAAALSRHGANPR